MRIYRSIKTNRITQIFGENKLPIYKKWGMLGHNGIDFAGRYGEPIYWNCDIRGKVYKITVDRVEGYGIDIITEDKDGIFKHRIWHLKGFAVYPKDVLESGDLIGWVGSTGYATGPHNHRSLKPVMWNGYKYINTKQGNGYFGAIDFSKYFTNIFILDLLEIQKKTLPILRQLIVLYKLLIDKRKGRL